jgi:acyl-CoA thioester hydrolase
MTETPDQPVLQELDFRLSYGDCDPAGIVYYGAYYPWFERTYNEWTVLGGFRPSWMYRLWGATHITVASGCRYTLPGRLHDPFTCRMRLGRLGRTSFTLHFSIDHRDDGRSYASGTMTFVFVDKADLDLDEVPRPAPVPEGLKKVLAEAGCTF